MVRSSTPQAADGKQSIGDLIALATKDITQLVRYEINLAVSELKADGKKVAIAVGLGMVAAFLLCLILMIACFALAYGLVAAFGMPIWQGFLCVIGACLVLAGILVLVAYLVIRKRSNLRRTKKTVKDDLNMLKRGDDERAEQQQITGQTS